MYIHVTYTCLSRIQITATKAEEPHSFTRHIVM